MRLSKSFIDKLPIPVSTEGKNIQRFYRDELLPGFALRITSGGSKSFIVERKLKGRTKRITLGQYGPLTLEQARRQAQIMLSEMVQGIDPTEQRSRDRAFNLTLEQAFLDYLDDRKVLKPSTIKDYHRNLNEGLKDWRNTRLKDITKDMVSQKHIVLGKKSHARANNAMGFLRAIFNHAIAKYEDAKGQPLLLFNPVDRLSQTRAWYPIPRRQTLIKPHSLPDWYRATCNLNAETTRDYLHFLLFTGLRRSEGSGLTWDNVDFDDKTFTIPITKNHRPHTLPLPAILLGMLREREGRSESIYVFPGKYPSAPLHNPETAIERVREASGVKFTLHDLRRTFITIAESLDIPGYVLKQLLNHKDPNDVTAGYIVMNIERLRGPMQKIADRIQHYVEPEPNAKVIDLAQYRAEN